MVSHFFHSYRSRFSSAWPSARVWQPSFLEICAVEVHLTFIYVFIKFVGSGACENNMLHKIGYIQHIVWLVPQLSVLVCTRTLWLPW